MPEPLEGNCLVAQSGGPTAVINASLAGVITEALNHECIEEIYGGLNGILGILNEDFIDLAEESQQTIRGLRYTPASALGTCRYKLHKSNDYERVLEVFMAHNIRYFFYIGGNDSQDTAAKISELARERGWEMRVMGIPKTVDNDLPVTDHCPGYGSVIKYISTVVKEIAADNASMGQGDLVSILEVMGRNAGWIAAGASLAKRRDHPNDPPHLIYLPEVAFDAGQLVQDVQNVLANNDYCFIVVGEGLVDRDGNYVTTFSGQTDSFGHAQLGGTADFLKGIIEESLPIKVRTARLGHGQRSAAHCASLTDNNEAFLAGETAVRVAVEDGVTDKMVTLLRGDGDQYSCETGLVDLTEVANNVKFLPGQWINEDGVSLSFQFVKYASPLIQGEVPVEWENGLPAYVELAKNRVPRQLGAHLFD